jgi:hypothetical protein
MFASTFDRTIRAGAFTTILALTAATAAQASTIHSQGGAPIRTTATAQAVNQGAAVSPSFTRIDNPLDPTFNQLLAIDNNGVISGYFGSGLQGHPNQAYVTKPPYNQFLPNNLPTSTQTQVQAYIAGGTASGFWSPSNTGTDQNFGFIELIVNGVVTYIDVNDPLTASTPKVNQLLGINKSLNAVGFYEDQNRAPHGYLYSVSTGKYFAVNVPGAVSDSAFGINAKNLICGAFTKADGKTDGFLESASSGKTIAFHVPGFTNTQFLGVNDNGIAVGFYNDAQNIPHGVIFNSANGAYTIVNDPAGLNGTTLNGINDKNQIVGFYTDGATNTHGVLVTGGIP